MILQPLHNFYSKPEKHTIYQNERTGNFKAGTLLIHLTAVIFAILTENFAKWHLNENVQCKVFDLLN